MKQNLYVGAILFAVTVMLFGITQADAQSATDDPAQVEAGKVVFETNCAGCHGVDGSGVTGLGRDLTGIADQQPDRSVNVNSVTNGKNFMPAWGETLSGEEIDAAVSYVRLTFVEAATAETTELAETGTETPVLAIGGATLLAAGALLVHYGRKEEEAA